MKIQQCNVELQDYYSLNMKFFLAHYSLGPVNMKFTLAHYSLGFMNFKIISIHHTLELYYLSWCERQEIL